MSVKVKFYSLFKINLKSSGKEYQIDGEITDLISMLDDDYDGYFSHKLLDAGEIAPGSIILINGENVIHIDGLDSKIKDGDTITLFPPSAGG
jgi:molybdopterin synthase sulfur carrier subunit